MKPLFRLALAVLFLAGAAFGQAAYSGPQVANVLTTVNGTSVVAPSPSAAVYVCTFPATYVSGSACTNKASVCPDPTGVGCTSSAPNNPITANARGEFGFFIAAGAWDYIVCPTTGSCSTPYHIFLPFGITPPNTVSLAGIVVAPSAGGTGANNTATSGRGLKGDGTNFVTTSTAVAGSGTLTCTNQFARVVNVNADAAPTGTCNTVTTTDADNTIAKTGTDISTGNQVTVTHLAAALPVAQGGTGVTSSTGTTNVVLSGSPTIATPTISAPTISGTAAMASATLSGTVSNYNGIALTGDGLPYEVATVDATAQTAAITTTTLYAVPASGAGQYLLSWDAKITTAAGTSSTLGALTIVYTDPDGVTVTLTSAAVISAGTVATTSAANTTGTVLIGIPQLINAKASTNITYAFAYASNAANAMNYNLHIKLRK